MFISRLFYLLSIAVFVMVTACTPQVAATPEATSAEVTAAPAVPLTPDEPVTLRLAVADEEGRPSDPYVHEFIDQVKTLSNGTITIEPTWDAGSATDAGFETGVIQLVKEGNFDLGLAASRAFDNEDITSFQALQAPFLIDNDALAQAVATSDTATRMMESLSSTGMVGLTMWPEDLRHPFSLVPGKPILSPQDFVGLSVRATPSQVTYQLIDALGGTPMMGDEYQAAESGLRQGASLIGTPTATGNVVFFAKFQVLFANGSSFEKLSEAQRNVLREAAIATQKKAIAEHPSDVDAASAWCADGGSIVLASDAQVASFETAAQPIFDSIAQNPLNAEFITAIRELKKNTEPSAGVKACNGAVAQSSPEPTLENEVWSEGLPPNGSWTVSLTIEDLIGQDVMQSKAAEWAGTYTWTFQDGKAEFDYKDPGGTGFGCQADVAAAGNVLKFTYTSGADCNNEVDNVQWRLDEDGLHLHLISIQNAPFGENKAVYEARPWQKVEEWSTGLPPEGVWRVELSADDFVRMGVMKSKANEWAGTYTWTLKDGHYMNLWEDGKGKSGKCVGTYSVVEDFVRLTSTTDDCPGEVEDFQWRLDDDGLHIHLIAVKNIGFTEVKANFEAKPWQKIADQ